MVRRACLLAHPVGAVREGDGRDAFLREIPGGKHRLAREQGAFLFQSQAVDDIGVFHGALLTIKKEGGRLPAALSVPMC